MGAPSLIADTIDCGLSYSVISYLKKLSQQVKSRWAWDSVSSKSQNMECCELWNIFSSDQLNN